MYPSRWQLTIENRLDRISIYGTIDLWKDKTGLKSARELKHLLDKVITELEKLDLSEKIEIVASDKGVVSVLILDPNVFIFADVPRTTRLKILKSSTVSNSFK